MQPDTVHSVIFLVGAIDLFKTLGACEMTSLVDQTSGLCQDGVSPEESIFAQQMDKTKTSYATFEAGGFGGHFNARPWEGRRQLVLKKREKKLSVKYKMNRYGKGVS